MDIDLRSPRLAYNGGSRADNTTTQGSGGESGMESKQQNEGQLFQWEKDCSPRGYWAILSIIIVVVILFSPGAYQINPQLLALLWEKIVCTRGIMLSQ